MINFKPINFITSVFKSNVFSEEIQNFPAYRNIKGEYQWKHIWFKEEDKES